ncbi:folic acid synthesis protein-like protein [Dothidotthia symphoricarpi CBS 119687]|uniref:Folic acid synthesis protein FOL1 n=1 Tax=Dothidotthia symphoricarpi CBS 119687 TaxID=1392245 RepID=A0A6A6A2N7_9PLEO|nr:folic acid synthesis protein-like protein [Dothidotthia symphoricarpi CBS 119687]KAF2124998.1 folic acid synthesis protein-like protein [Dothidotthia symphoricarpi CBS 119687]
MTRSLWSSYVRSLSTSCIQHQNVLSSLQTDSARLRLVLWRPSKTHERHIVRVSHNHTKLEHRAFIALGGNMGDRVAMIEEACREMEKGGNIRILRTSSLWETKAMYVLDQDNFVNGACEIETSLSPIELLNELQSVEKRMGRVKVIDKGPRNIDLDILLYDNLTHSNERLQIPHPLMLEREFVLRPLCEMIPEENLPSHSSSAAKSLQHSLSLLPRSEDPLSPMTPLAPNLSSISAFQPQRDTRIMSILNVTPDSFSDGGKNYNIDQVTLTNTIKSHITSGATILDIGGQSTRPGAVQVSSSEELSRILPAIKLIRSLREANNLAISIDTYRADVAEESIKAGAHIINDVSAGLMDDAMLHTVAKLGCTVCLMHMRGTPETMSKLTSYPDGIIETVGRELLDRVRAAEAAGIRRWRIILDPGIGFAKTQEQNLEILRRMGELRQYPGLQGFPWLVGTSRKAFVGKITGVKEAKDRKWGTAAAVTAAIQGGADIVRVHDVEEMGQVAKLADAIWRV